MRNKERGPMSNDIQIITDKEQMRRILENLAVYQSKIGMTFNVKVNDRTVTTVEEYVE
jgi:hydroxymethylpyrimidine/phosphomethylpyrimidine kinase